MRREWGSKSTPYAPFLHTIHATYRSGGTLLDVFPAIPKESKALQQGRPVRDNIATRMVHTAAVSIPVLGMIALYEAFRIGRRNTFPSTYHIARGVIKTVPFLGTQTGTEKKESSPLRPRGTRREHVPQPGGTRLNGHREGKQSDREYHPEP